MKRYIGERRLTVNFAVFYLEHVSYERLVGDDALWGDLHGDILPVHVILEWQYLQKLAVKSDGYGSC